MNIIKFPALALVVIQLLFSCNNSDKAQDTNDPKIDSTRIIDSIKQSDAFKKTLKEYHIPKTAITISIPSDYSAKIINGPSFVMHYFSPSDTSVHDFIFGLYLGGEKPDIVLRKFDFSKGALLATDFSSTHPDNDSCKNWIEPGPVVRNKADWIVYNCNEEYFLQTSISSEQKSDWFHTIHIFGKTRSQNKLNILHDIFSTIKQE